MLSSCELRQTVSPTTVESGADNKRPLLHENEFGRFNTMPRLESVEVRTTRKIQGVTLDLVNSLIPSGQPARPQNSLDGDLHP